MELCPSGHPRTEANTYVSPRGALSCRPCTRAAVKRYRATEKGKEAARRSNRKTGAQRVARYKARHRERVMKEHREYQRAWRATERGKRMKKDTTLRAHYGITLEDFEQMIAKQDGRCAICRKELDRARYTHVDHCHETNKIRGVLCHFCNTGLGQFRENPELLTAAINYLKGGTP